MHQTKIRSMMARLAITAGAMVLAAALTSPARAAAPGITGGAGTPVFNLMAHDGYINQPDGAQVYTWGYGCTSPTAPASWVPAAIAPPSTGCPVMQIPAPTLVVTEGDTVTVNLTNNLPPAAGNTSILFPGFQVSASSATTGCVVQGVLTSEVPNGCTISYTFVAGAPGTRSYYSGTQSDLQVEMGMYGAIIVLPRTINAACTSGLAANNLIAEQTWGEADYRLPNSSGGVGAAYDHGKTCYDREYLFQFSEMDLTIHQAAQAQVLATTNSGVCLAASKVGCGMEVPTEPYKPSYFLVNGRSMPDDMDPNYAPQYPNQPYNGNPHMHPGEQVLLRVIGQGRWEHPFHEHANHVRILARDGNLLTSATDPTKLAGLLMFTTDTFPGQSFDGIFYYTGRGLNWDMYGHNPTSSDPLATLTCTPDANGYNTANPKAVNYYEWCQDHNKPVEANPVGDVPGGGPVTLPNANIFTNGAWYGGSPYLGPDATLRSTSTSNNITATPVTGQVGCTTNGVSAAAGSGAAATAVYNAAYNAAYTPAYNAAYAAALAATGGTVASATAAGVAAGIAAGNAAGAAAAPAEAAAAVAANTTAGCTNLQPSNIQANPANERGFAFMWHSHNEREITTNNVFPGGMFMMMLVDSREFVIDESN